MTFPPYEIRKLANGLQVVLVSQNEQPSISVRMIIRAGAAQDPKNKLGVAMLTATLLDQGAGNRTGRADRRHHRLHRRRARHRRRQRPQLRQRHRDERQLRRGARADGRRRAAADVRQEEIERQRQQALSALKVSAEDPEAVAGQVIDRLIYGFHPYGLPGSGTAESLASLTRADFVDFHRSYFVPNNALIAVVGDIAPTRR